MTTLGHMRSNNEQKAKKKTSLPQPLLIVIITGNSLLRLQKELS